MLEFVEIEIGSNALVVGSENGAGYLGRSDCGSGCHDGQHEDQYRDFRA
ncbi:MAG: hypothetical protein ACYTEX_09430 [Planctomycetota bacterium]|jgi:hypothetical protein